MLREVPGGLGAAVNRAVLPRGQALGRCHAGVWVICHKTVKMDFCIKLHGF